MFALRIAGKKACFEVIRFENGRLTDSEHWLLDPPENLSAARSALIERYYLCGTGCLPGSLWTESWRTRNCCLPGWKISEAKVSLIHPQKGEHLSIVQLCIKNANEHRAERRALRARVRRPEELAQLLGLPQAPEYIESYDISPLV